MVVTVSADDAAEAAVLAGADAAWKRLHERIAHRFGRAEVRARVRRYLAGVLQRVERKNGWQLAEAIGEAGPQGVQRLLRTSAWDADAGCDDLRAYVIEHLGDTDTGLLIVDQTSFPKKGTPSCGVAMQYCGTLGRSANAQVGVFLGYTSLYGTAFIDRALDLPRAWTTDRARCAAAGVPAAVEFATKRPLAKRLLARAFAAKVPARWVVAATVYGRAHHFRHWLEARNRAYLVGVVPTQVVVVDGQRQRASALAASLPSTAWIRRSAGAGSQGERIYAWACVRLGEAVGADMARWLIVRRSLERPEDCASQRADGPADTPAAELVPVAGARWSIEEGFAQAKGEVGLDHSEVRHWTAWHRHITLGLLAHAYMVVVAAWARAATRCDDKEGVDATASLVALMVAEVRRLLLAVGAESAQQAFLVRWSRWRRAHQAVAKRCHCARQARKRAGLPLPATATPLATSELTDIDWGRLVPLLPPQRPSTGRPRHDHRTVLGGILWVMRTASPWREMPARFGKWDTAYARYRLWLAEGRWQRIVDALGQGVPLATPP